MRDNVKHYCDFKAYARSLNRSYASSLESIL